MDTLDHKKTADYRESYANNVDMRWMIWDFFLSFGTVVQTTPQKVEVLDFQGLFLSPQQAKAVANLLNDGIHKYEAQFGEIKLAEQTPGSVIQ